jgi:outer membrane lipoprotein-sorting protein
MDRHPFALRGTPGWCPQLVSLLALLFAACFPLATPLRLPKLPAAPEARLAAVRAEEDRVHSLRARFSSVTRMPGAERSADGVLLVAKPDRFRLRLMLPFGLTVFDYLNVGDQSWMTLPLADSQQRAHAQEFAPFSRDDLGQAFLRGAYAFPGDCTAADADAAQVAVRCRVDGALRRSLLIGDEGIVEETSYAGDTPRMVIRYADYRGGLPYHITLEYPQHQSVDITIQQYEVNPTLSDDLFRPVADSAPQSHVEDRAPNGGRQPSAGT